MNTPFCVLALAVFLVQVNGEAEKRSISTLARGGQLPGKRYVAALAKNGEYPRSSWDKKYNSLESMAERLQEDQYTKRYLGALARTGDLRVARDNEEKRDDVDSLIRELASADELRRLRLEALREELFKEREEEPEHEQVEETGKTERTPGKRSVEALARIGLLKPSTTTHDFSEDESDFEKKITDDFMDEDKRGGISSLARNGYYNKRTVDEELEELMNEVYGIGEKRNVASMARGFNLPSGKRSEEETEEKRNVQSLMRDRSSPIGKRNVDPFVANNAIPFVNNDKRNVGALAKNRDFPYAYRFGKREVSQEDSEEMSKRYVATLLRDGRLPIGPDGAQNQDDSNKEDMAGKDDSSQVTSDQTASLREKKNVSAEEKEEVHSRAKRESFISPLAEEMIAPVGDIEFGDAAYADENKWADDTSPLNKRFFAVRGGKMPGGRLPKVGGRSRSRHNSSRRRH